MGHAMNECKKLDEKLKMMMEDEGGISSESETMDATPEFWTTQELTEKELADICTWLWRWQAACVSSDTIAQDFIKEGEQPPSQKLDPAFRTAMGHVQSLVRHIGALRKQQSQLYQDK